MPDPLVDRRCLRQAGSQRRSAPTSPMPQLFIAGSIALAALVAFAFWPGYFSKSPATVDSYTHFHAAIAALWLSLLVVQPVFVVTRRRKWHRLLGRTSWLLAPLFVVSSFLLAHFRFARMDDPTFVDEAYTLYLPLSTALLFTASFALAMLHRKNVQLHSRFLACTALLLVDPVCGRVLALYVLELPRFWHYQLITFGIEVAVLLVLTLTLPARSGPRRAFSLFAALYASVLATWFVGARTAPWFAIANWFRGLPLT